MVDMTVRVRREPYKCVVGFFWCIVQAYGLKGVQKQLLRVIISQCYPAQSTSGVSLVIEIALQNRV